MYQLRDYQIKGVNTAVKHLLTYKKPFIVQAATGAGKSLMIAEICKRINEPTLVLQPSKELLEQNYDKLMSYHQIPDEDIGMYSASVGKKQIRKFTYATIGSIYKHPELFAHFKYVIIDECHLVNPKGFGTKTGKGMYAKFLKAINCTSVCGLTATPYRLESKFFNDPKLGMVYTSCLKMLNRIYPHFFKKIAFKIETAELIEQKYLSPIRYLIHDDDIAGLRTNTTGSDFTPESLDSYWNDTRLKKLAGVIQHIDKTHKRNLIFCSSIRQAQRAHAILKAMGITSAVVTGETPKSEREKLVQDFRDGKIPHMINVGVFTTGFDVPELESIVLARPTMSMGLYYQMIGRGVRIDPNNPDKILHVYDLAGCVERLGRVETIKLGKEEDGFRDVVYSEVGQMTDTPLFTFLVKSDKFKSVRKTI